MIKSGRFGRFLRLSRINAQLSQVELAKRLGYKAQFVANWERGKCNPPLYALKKISYELSISKRQLQIEFLKYQKEILSFYLNDDG